MGNDNVKDYPPYLDYPKPRKPQANADRIRSMSDEEPADFMLFYNDQYDFEGWLDWLRQEVSDEP